MPVPPGTLIPQCSWPGITHGVQSFQYAVSHGISPSVALIVTNPQPKPPAGFGNLYWSDGRHGMALSNCKLSRLKPSIGPGGFTYTLEILDRRWQWANGTFPNGGGKYNQLDDHGKLIPMTVRSPRELALLCLKAMGERQFRIEGLPTGLSSRDGRRITRYLNTGENYPLTAANPPTDWTGIPPAVALTELCDRYGCRVVFQPRQDRLLIQRLGVGTPLTPAGSLASASASMESPETPKAVVVYGAMCQYQGRFALEPVLLDWDHRYVPNDQASYAPTIPAGVNQRQITRCEVRPAGDAATASFSMHFEWGSVTGGVGLSSLFAFLQNSIRLANAGITAVLTSASVITLTGPDKQPFSVQCRMTGGSTDRSRFDARITQPAKSLVVKDWGKVFPGVWFQGIQATDRLSIIEARSLAQRSLWRAYRFMDEDVTVAHANKKYRERTGQQRPYKPIIVPGFGPIINRRQLIPLNVKVEQVIPSPRIGAPFVKNQQELAGAGLLPEYYNGYARNQVARIYGQYAKHIGSVLWNTRADLNTDPMSLVKVEFQLDPFNQVIIFSEPVYRQNDQGAEGVYVDPELIIECAVMVRDPNTWSERRPEYIRPLIGGIAPPECIIREDVIANFIGVYDDENRLIRVTRPPEDADAPLRAEEYCRGMAAKYQTTAAQVQTWNGIVPVDPDGVVQQVSWSIGPAGIYTTAGTNSEFSTYLPAYSARRQRENLAANPDAAIANIKDVAAVAAARALNRGFVASALAMR